MFTIPTNPLSVQPVMEPNQESMNALLLAHWAVLEQGLQKPCSVLPISGHQLDIATVLLIARYAFDTNLPILART